MKKSTVDILGINFLSTTNREFIEQLKKDSLHHQNRFVVTANPEIVLAARKDKEYQKTIKQADYVIADGIGIIIGGSILKTPLPERVTGYDTLISLLNFANKYSKKIFLVGAKPEVISQVQVNIKNDFPNIKIVGAYDGYFKDDHHITSAIASSQPDFVFAALGFPKQEYFIAKNKNLAPAIWMGVGGSFDVLAGMSKRAPVFWQKHHIEWLYRLIQEPSRIGRMMALPKYLLLVYRKKFFKR